MNKIRQAIGEMSKELIPLIKDISRTEIGMFEMCNRTLDIMVEERNRTLDKWNLNKNKIEDILLQLEVLISEESRFIKCPLEGDLVKVYISDHRFAFGRVTKVVVLDAGKYNYDQDEIVQKGRRQFVLLDPCENYKTPDFFFSRSNCIWKSRPTIFNNKPEVAPLIVETNN